jgi:hypothetical protein
MVVKMNNDIGFTQTGAPFTISNNVMPYKTTKKSAIAKRIFDAIFDD